MHLEHKEIPLGSGNLYWYKRIYVNGRQKSVYVGRRLPPDLAEFGKEAYQSARDREKKRSEIEQKISNLQKELKSL